MFKIKNKTNGMTLRTGFNTRKEASDLTKKGSIMKDSISKYLEKKYNIDSDSVRYAEEEGLDQGAVEVYGTMPNTSKEEWFFAGYDSEIEAEICD